MFELNFNDITKPFTLTYSVLRHLNKIATPSDNEYLTSREIEFEEEIVDYLYDRISMSWENYCALWMRAFDTDKDIADIFKEFKDNETKGED